MRRRGRFNPVSCQTRALARSRAACPRASAPDASPHHGCAGPARGRIPDRRRGRTRDKDLDLARSTIIAPVTSRTRCSTIVPLLDRNELNAQAHNNLGSLYQEKHLLAESARELQRATLIEPRNAGTHNNYGVTLLMLGRTRRVCRRVSDRTVDRSSPPRRPHQSESRPAPAGQLDTAKETLVRVLNLAPQNARRALQSCSVVRSRRAGARAGALSNVSRVRGPRTRRSGRRRAGPDRSIEQEARLTMSEIDHLLQEDRSFPPPRAAEDRQHLRPRHL